MLLTKIDRKNIQRGTTNIQTKQKERENWKKFDLNQFIRSTLDCEFFMLRLFLSEVVKPMIIQACFPRLDLYSEL